MLSLSISTHLPIFLFIIDAFLTCQTPGSAVSLSWDPPPPSPLYNLSAAIADPDVWDIAFNSSSSWSSRSRTTLGGGARN